MCSEWGDCLWFDCPNRRTGIACSDRSDGRGAMDEPACTLPVASETVIATARRLLLSQTAGRSGACAGGDALCEQRWCLLQNSSY